MAVGIETIPNKLGRDTVLMRRSWRAGKRVRKTTLPNLTDFPPAPRSTGLRRSCTADAAACAIWPSAPG